MRGQIIVSAIAVTSSVACGLNVLLYKQNCKPKILASIEPQAINPIMREK
jgi:hypothetical protein